MIKHERDKIGYDIERVILDKDLHAADGPV